MNYRLYYSAPNLEAAEECYQLSKELDIAQGHFSVISYDTAELEYRHLPAADYFKSLDLVQSSLSGLGFGTLAGAAVLAFLFVLQPYSLYIPVHYYWIPVAVTACFGLWAGLMTGLAKTNHHLAPFKNRLRRGVAVVMIDVTEEKRPLVEQMIKQRVPKAKLEKADYLGDTFLDKTG